MCTDKTQLFLSVHNFKQLLHISRIKHYKMGIIQYQDEFKDGAIGLILDIQNNEAKIDLSIAEQPDLLNIHEAYINGGGNFWVAVDNGQVVGTIALMRIDDNWSVLKKFFVRADYRSQKVGLALYATLLEFAKENGVRHIILDTPSVATKSHSFYERAGFRRIGKEDLQVQYSYPDRHSILYQLDIH